MIIYLPCKLGETFKTKMFCDWKDGQRVYKDGFDATLLGFSAGEYDTRFLSIPLMHTDKGFFQYDDKREYNQEFTPKYKIELDVKSVHPLEHWGFSSKKAARLSGLTLQNDILYAEFITADRNEHISCPIKGTLKYYELNEEIEELKVAYKKLTKREEK